jgi:hypothetical protein
MGIIALGSGSREGRLYFIKDISAVKDVESGPRFKVGNSQDIVRKQF